MLANIPMRWPMAKVAGFFDKDGDNNPLNALAAMAKGLFGKS